MLIRRTKCTNTGLAGRHGRSGAAAKDGQRFPGRAAAGLTALLLALALVPSAAVVPSARGAELPAPVVAEVPDPATAVPPPVADEGPFNLTIFHTNDTHSSFLARPADWRDDGRPVGGVLALAHHLAEQRRTSRADLLVDAGDFMTGNPVCNLREDGVPGVAIARMFNALDYDVGLIGNHEFDIGVDDLKKLVTRFEHPLLAADIVDTNGRPVFRAAPIVFERGGVRVGVLGVSCGEMTEVVAPSRFAGLVMAPQVPRLRGQAEAFDAETDLLIVLSHNGLDEDRKLAEALAGSGIDVIVGGHSHTRMKKPELVAGILIVQAGAAMQNLGRLDLRVEDDRVTGYAGSLVSLWADSLKTDGGLSANAGLSTLATLVEGYQAQVMTEYGQQLGTLAVDLKRGRGETMLGDWLADVLREAAAADVGLINSGGIRRDLSEGPITALNIQEVLPFANSLVTVRLTGTELAAVADWNAAAQASGDHGILQVSGIAYEIVPGTGGAGARAGDLTVGGRPVDAAASYLVAMPDFVAMMGPVYLGRPNPPFTDLGRDLASVTAEAVRKAGTVTAPVGGRIRGAEGR